MPRFHTFLILAAIVLSIAACGGSGGDTAALDRSVSKQPKPSCVAHADVTEAGCPARVRLWAENDGSVEIVQWFWRIDGVWHDATAAGGVFWLDIKDPGTTNPLLRGVDSKGRDCTSPLHIRSRERYNSPPVVLFDGPQDFGEHEEMQADGTVLRYHEWRWDISRSYDPETEIVALDWGIYGGGDLDGDGIPDTLYAFKLAPLNGGLEGSRLAGLIVRHIDDPEQFILWVTPELAMSPLRMAVTATDTAAASRKWGDGHVTLMK